MKRRFFNDSQLIPGKSYSMFTDIIYVFIGIENNVMIFEVEGNIYSFNYEINGLKIWYFNPPFKFGRK